MDANGGIRNICAFPSSAPWPKTFPGPFARTLASLLTNGVPLVPAMGIVQNVVENVHLAEGIGAAAEEIGEGRGLGESLANKPGFPSITIQMMEVGEQSGELEAMLEKMADMYEAETENTINTLTSSLEAHSDCGHGRGRGIYRFFHIDAHDGAYHDIAVIPFYSGQLISEDNAKMNRKVIKGDFGFTLLEVMVVIVILGMLFAYVGVRVMGASDQAKVDMAKMQIQTFETALNMFKLHNGFYPSTDQGLQALVEKPSTARQPPAISRADILPRVRCRRTPGKMNMFTDAPARTAITTLSPWERTASWAAWISPRTSIPGNWINAFIHAGNDNHG